MLEYKDYPIYRQEIVKYTETIVPQNVNKILVFGDKLHSLDYKWSKSRPETKITNLDSLNKNWIYISDNNPEIDLALEKDSFDMIISYHGIEKSLDPERLILQLRRGLSSSGQIIFITYNASHIHSLYHILDDELLSIKDGAFKEGNIQRFSYNQLKYLFEDTGLEIQKEEIYGTKEESIMAKQLIRVTKNPYIIALSFVFICKKVETFPFIENIYL